MLGRLATRLYGIGRRTVTGLMKLKAASDIGTIAKAARPAPAKVVKPRRQRPITARVVNSKRHNQTVPPKHSAAVKAKFKQASGRRV